jgi:curved DNA-binding protein
MDFVDYYKLLGIDKKATTRDIKTAYRKLARRFHPDLNPNDKNANKNFQQINEANKVLSDPVKRKKYDQYGEEWQQAEQFDKQKQYQEQSSAKRGARYQSAQNEGDFSDFFESMFGGSGRSRQTRYRGEDYTSELKLDLMDAYSTHKQTLTVNGNKIRITIPAGVDNGQTIKIPGHGGKGRNGGPDGDLFISFLISNNSKFRRLGDNLYLSVVLDLYTAVLGGEITLDILKGKVKLKVKPETQNGSKVKLKDKGVPVYKYEGKFGDLFITYTVKIPTNITEKQKVLFTELSES